VGPRIRRSLNQIAEPVDAEPGQHSSLNQETASRRVLLVVDDDADVRTFLDRLLTSRGYAVVSAPHGKDALDRLREHAPDLVLLDLNMPVMDGWHFLAEQRHLANPALTSVPVLLVTAAEGVARAATTLHTAGVIAKPFDPDRLLDAIRQTLTAPVPPADAPGLPPA
jgi:CheY-like chemotaxis protein